MAQCHELRGELAMKKTFDCFYPPTQKELDRLWKKAVIAFDASALLNLYRYSEQTRQAFLDTLRKLNDRIWLPHQAALEYHRGRINAIHNELEQYDGIVPKFQPIHDTLVTQFGHPFILPDTVDQLKTLFQTIAEELKQGKATHESLLRNDPILDRLTTLFDRLVGSHYPKERQSKIESEGKDRYLKDIPPGYRDKGKTKGDPFGDLILWNQMLDKAKEHKKGLIFVTDDATDDWWQEHTDLPRPELKEEMQQIAGSAFHMYKSRTFWEQAARLAGDPVVPAVIDELEATLTPVMLETQHAKALMILADISALMGNIELWSKNRRFDTRADLSGIIDMLGRQAGIIRRRWGATLPDDLKHRLSAIGEQCRETVDLDIPAQIRKADYLELAASQFLNDIRLHMGIGIGTGI